MIIAIDGTAASGKGTLGRTLAMRLHFDYLDTGQLYRAVGYFALAKGLDLEVSDPKEIVKIATNLDLRQPFGKELRTSEVGKAASKVAAFAEVRHALLRKQRNFAKNPPNKKAWKLIDEAGCRGLQNGDAMISQKHCNFIINLKKSSSQQIEELAKIVQEKVFKKSGIQLDWEIQRVGIK